MEVVAEHVWGRAGKKRENGFVFLCEASPG